MSDLNLNELMIEWMKERWDEARERNTKGAPVYKRAHKSLVDCPMKFLHPSETERLTGIGPGLIKWLTDKLEKHCNDNGLPMPTRRGNVAKRRAELAALDQSPGKSTEQPTRKARTSKQYIPKERSGAYAIMWALSSPQIDGKRGLVKSDLQREAQPFCDSSFTTPSDPTKFYTAWKSIDTLTSKELVCTVGRPVTRYLLTDEGWEVAHQMRAAEGDPDALAYVKSKQPKSTDTAKSTKGAKAETSKTVPESKRLTNTTSLVMDLTLSPRPEVQTQCEGSLAGQVSESEPEERVRTQPCSLYDVDPFCLPAGSFTVQLVLDTREVRTKDDRDYMSNELQKQGVKPILRSLPVGDALWIAKVNPPHSDGLALSNPGDEDEGKDEIVLDYILERKRLDDLIFSIKDGRFREQKFRLRKSGLKHVIYLIEEYSISSDRSETYGDSLESAIASMEVVNGFFVKQTAKMDETIRYLASMTKSLKEKYERIDIRVVPTRALEGRTLPSMIATLQQLKPGLNYYITFSAFASMCNKSEALTLRDVYLKMLMCVRGLTGEKAIEIQRKWPTPNALIEAFAAQANDGARQNMISDKLGGLIPRKKVAKVLSTKIAEVWT